MLACLGFLATVFGLISLLRPLRRVGIRSRRSAAWVLTAGLLTSLVARTDTPAAGPPATQIREESPAGGQEAPATPTQEGRLPPAPHPEAGSGSAPPPAGNGAEADAAGEEAERDQALRQGITKATVTDVVDGDTIDVAYVAGAPLPDTRIRMIGVDTPEVHGETEAYGAEASAFSKEQLTGATVWLERDVSETDRYGRALRYVWLTEPPAEPTEDDVRRHMFNALLLLGGYAQVSTHPPDVKYADLFVVLQREAREAGTGLWGLQEQGLQEEQAAPNRDSGSRNDGSGRAGQSASQGQNCDPSYPDVCIPPPPPDLDCGDIPHRNFRVLPPDPHRFDGDQDGLGCET